MRAQPTLWLLGPTSSGKTTLARALAERLRSQGRPCLWYDGDEVRDFFGPDLGFKPDDRLKVVRTLCHLANKGSHEGIAVIVSALTANPEARELVFSSVERLALVGVCCSVEVCAQRDPKGLYHKAKKGEINTLIGFNTPYTLPERCDLVLSTQSRSVEECVKELEEFLDKRTDKTGVD